MATSSRIAETVSSGDTLSDNVGAISKEGNQQSMPNKSHFRYVQTYEKFLHWQKSNKTNSYDEDTLLTYFGELGLLSFLKQKSEGFVSKKANVFYADEIKKFLMEAPESYLAIKVVLLFIISGAGSGENLTAISTKNVTDCDTEIVVRTEDSEANVDRVCSISGEYVHIVRNYMRLRPTKICTDRFFIKYRDGYCTTQHMGKLSIAKMPQKVAEYLRLPNPAAYSIHSFKNAIHIKTEDDTMDDDDITIVDRSTFHADINYEDPYSPSSSSNTSKKIKYSDVNDVPGNSMDTRNQSVQQSLADKSQYRYVQAYEKFLHWQKSNNTNSFDEDTLLTYFSGLAKTFAPTSLSTVYSMLKSTINSNQNVDIGRYDRLLAFVKQKNEGFVSKKANVFYADEIKKFLIEAPESYLAIKVMTLFIMAGAGSGEKLTTIIMEHVRDYGREIVVRIPDVETNNDRVFLISDEFVHIVRNYMRLRPSKISTEKFFIHYRDGKCKGQNIGKNTIAKVPHKIAEYLGLPDPSGYTTQSLRHIATRNDLFNVKQTQKIVLPSATPNPSPNLRIKQEDEDFEAGQYEPNDSNRHTSHDIQIKTEDNAVDSCSTVSPANTLCRSSSICQQTIKAQAEEIARLKQAIERQNSKIENLELMLLDNLQAKFTS